jgi:hypothetical protein
MDNNSQVTGNVYSNGDIIGGNNGSVITGDVIAAATSAVRNIAVQGSDSSHVISNSTVSKDSSNYALDTTQVTGNVSANSLAGPKCSVGGNATYNTITNCPVSGTTTSPNPNVPTDPKVLSLPIDQAQIDSWTQEAANGGVIGGQTITGSVSLGPIKVNGDLIIDGTVTMTGTIWVTGNLTLQNGAQVLLSPSFGALSGEIIVGTAGTTTNGYININQGVIVNGSGTSGSYVMLLSQRDTTTNSNIAITASNNSAAAILYANNGLVDVINNASLREITAWKVHLHNLSTVVYDTGYASADFTTGPSGGWQEADQTWQLLQ